MRIYKVRCYSVLQSLPLLATAAMLPTAPTTICYSYLPPKSRTRHGTTGAGAPSTVQTLMTSKSTGNYLTMPRYFSLTNSKQGLQVKIRPLLVGLRTLGFSYDQCVERCNTVVPGRKSSGYLHIGQGGRRSTQNCILLAPLALPVALQLQSRSQECTKYLTQHK